MQDLPRLLTTAVLCLSTVPFFTTLSIAANGELEIRIVDQDTEQPVAAQIEIRDRRGHVRPIRHTASWQGRSAVDGRVIVSLSPGKYTFTVDRGPEYLDQSGHFVILSTATDNTSIRMKRFTSMSDQGWYSADLSVSRPEREMELLLRSADLHMASVQSWSFDNSWTPTHGTDFASKWNRNGDRLFDVSAGRDDRLGGTALVFRAERQFSFGDNGTTSPPSTDFFKRAKRAENAHLCIGQANAWDLPIWLASGYVDSFMLLGPELRHDGKKTKDPAGLPRDRVFFPEPHGWGQWAQAIYYHILNSGLRLPPIAGSGSGIGPNPIGSARTYVHCGDTLEPNRWWEQLRDGRVMVTNGPLLIPQVNGELPGHVFTGYAGETVSLTTQLTLHTREKIEYLEVIKNGEVVDDVMLSELVDKQGVLSDVEFTESGWLLIRAVTKNPTYHAASTGPYYVQFDDKPRISRKSVQFFLDWLKERADVVDNDIPDQRYHQAAQKYWEQRVNLSSAP